MKIFVTSDAGKTMTAVDAEPTDTVEHLKYKVMAVTTTHEALAHQNGQHLTFEGRFLEDGSTVAECGLAADAVLQWSGGGGGFDGTSATSATAMMMEEDNRAPKSESDCSEGSNDVSCFFWQIFNGNFFSCVLCVVEVSWESLWILFLGSKRKTRHFLWGRSGKILTGLLFCMRIINRIECLWRFSVESFLFDEFTDLCVSSRTMGWEHHGSWSNFESSCDVGAFEVNF